MVKIGRFVFKKFLPPPEKVGVGVQWLEFTRIDGKKHDKADIAELMAIIEENRPESDKISYINVGDSSNYAHSTGMLPATENSWIIEGIILALKGGTQNDALEYIKQIADRVQR